MAEMYPLYEREELSSKIENRGERLFYEACLALPDSFTVVYSFSYQQREKGEREADFVILHPSLGYLVIEVKQGEIEYRNRKWYRWENGFTELDKDPQEQARTAMFYIRDKYKEKTNRSFPLTHAYALCFPDSENIKGILPVEDEMVFTKHSLEDLETSIKNAFTIWSKMASNQNANKVIQEMIQHVLAPTFRARKQILGEWIKHVSGTAELVYTEEQQHILDATSLENRLLFLGSAGSGKTFIAMEKAQMLANEGKRVLLTCYNVHLAEFMSNQMKMKCKNHHLIEVKNYHNFTMSYLRRNGVSFEIPSFPRDKDMFFKRTIPELVTDCCVFSSPMFDSVIIDEGQDFSEEWLISLDSLLVEDGELYMFVDENQTLFGNFDERIKDFLSCSRYRLTKNLRNTDTIHEWVTQYSKKMDYISRVKLKEGKPVKSNAWRTQEEEKKAVKKEINYLLSQGISIQQMVILSPNRKENSSLKSTSQIGNIFIEERSEKKDNVIRFATIKSFKGLESDVVLLIGVKPDDYLCKDADLYVGGSRAKFYLHVFHHEDFKSRI